MLELLKSRRSIRKFADKKVEKEKIEAILKGVLTAPTSSNNRPWQFVVVEDKEKLIKLSKCREMGSQFIDGAPLAIAVTVSGEKDTWIEDATIAATIIQLTSHSLGLGTCWVHVRNRQQSGNVSTEDYIMDVLDIPKSVKVECIIAIGYPDEEKPPHDVEELFKERVHYETF